MSGPITDDLDVVVPPRAHRSSVWLDCTLEREIGAGDQGMARRRIEKSNLTPDVPPLVFYGSRFRSLAE